jgi:hypothetical protein
MPLFTQQRDISFFRHVNRELINRIICQEFGYYKLSLKDTPTNSYGESKGKYYYDVVLLTGLVERPELSTEDAEYGASTIASKVFRFLRDDLILLNLVPERGDIIMYNEAYYEVDNTNENQFIGGKAPEHYLEPALEKFGSSWSVSCETHITSINKLNIVNFR